MILSEEQSSVLASVEAGENLLVTGPGGTGKSFLLEHVKGNLEYRGKCFTVCAATGVAAVNVGGTTVHSTFGIGLGQGSIHGLVNNIRNNVPCCKRLRALDTVLIDEISMISADLFGKLDGILKILRENELPFGGLQIILFGDFLQLPPVEGQYAFKSKAWKEAGIKVVTLTKIFRQSDLVFAGSLNQLRKGKLDQSAKDFFNARARARDQNPEIPAVDITAKNDKADAINRQRLDALPGPSHTWHAKDSGSPSGLKLLEKCIVPAELTLKKGARVMCCVNLPEVEVMNGTCGTVTGFTALAQGVEVLFDNGVRLEVFDAERTVTQENRVIATRKQIPLRLAWAISAHKSQGCTLDKIRVHMGEAFEHSQQYVALSRVRTPEGLFIASINKDMISADPEALAFYGES